MQPTTRLNGPPNVTFGIWRRKSKGDREEQIAALRRHLEEIAPLAGPFGESVRQGHFLSREVQEALQQCAIHGSLVVPLCVMGKLQYGDLLYLTREAAQKQVLAALKKPQTPDVTAGIDKFSAVHGYKALLDLEEQLGTEPNSAVRQTCRYHLGLAAARFLERNKWQPTVP